ncbi:MAG: glutathione S-transferase family protein [Pseudomonadota bacterium]
MSLVLVQYKRGFGVANLSPFCMKAEILLKMSGKPFSIELLDDPRKTPKGKLPMLRDDGTDVPDSTFMQTHLETAHGVDFYPDISAKDKAIGHAAARMCEERLYWVLLYARWIEPENWSKISDFWFGDMPILMRTLIPKVALKEVKGNLRAHGLGRHSRDDIYALGKSDIDALATLLGDQDFMLGRTPTAADASIYPFIENTLIEALPSPLLDAAKAHDNLVAYAARCRSLWFSDRA